MAIESSGTGYAQVRTSNCLPAGPPRQTRGTYPESHVSDLRQNNEGLRGRRLTNGDFRRRKRAHAGARTGGLMNDFEPAAEARAGGALQPVVVQPIGQAGSRPVLLVVPAREDLLPPPRINPQLPGTGGQPRQAKHVVEPVPVGGDDVGGRDGEGRKSPRVGRQAGNAKAAGRGKHPRGPSAIVVTHSTHGQGSAVGRQGHGDALSGRAHGPGTNELGPLLAPARAAAGEHPRGPAAGVPAEVAVPVPAHGQGGSVGGKGHGIALVGKTHGPGADEFGALLAPVRAAAGEHPRGPAVLVVTRSARGQGAAVGRQGHGIALGYIGSHGPGADELGALLGPARAAAGEHPRGPATAEPADTAGVAVPVPAHGQGGAVGGKGHGIALGSTRSRGPDADELRALLGRVQRRAGDGERGGRRGRGPARGRDGATSGAG